MADKPNTPPGGKVYQPNLRLIAKVPVLKTKSPDFLFELWKGYWNMPDPTTLTSLVKESVLTYPSVNCSVPYNDMIVPDLGKTLLGQEYTQNSGMNGQYTKYTNKNGDEMEVRTWRDTVDTERGDVVEVLWTNTETNVASWVPITQEVNPLDLAPIDPRTNRIHRFKFTQASDVSLNGVSLNLPRLVWVNGTTNIKTWTGGITVIGTVTGTTIATASGKTWDSLGFPNLTPAPQSSTGVNIIVNGILYTVISGWDTNIITVSSTSGISAGNIAVAAPTQLPSTVDFTLNYTQTGTVIFQANEVVTGSISGATGTISYVTTGESPTMTVIPLNGSQFVGNDVLTGSTSGAQGTVTNVTNGTIAFDYCDTIQNYVLYGNWGSKQFYISNEYNYEADQQITNFNAGTGVINQNNSNLSSNTSTQAASIVSGSGTAGNDLTLVSNTFYTGYGYHIYTVTIDSVSPAVNQLNYVSVNGGTSSSGLVTTGYDASGGNYYQFSIASDITLITTGSSSSFVPGDIVVGQTSKATARVVYQNPTDGDVFAQQLTGTFDRGETIEALSSGNTVTLDGASFYNCAQFFKNNVQVTSGITTIGPGLIQLATAGSYTLIDGLTFDCAGVGSNITGDYWTLTIQTLNPDTYRVQVDGNPALPGNTGIYIAGQTGQVLYTPVSGTFLPNERIFDLASGTEVATSLIVNAPITAGTLNLYQLVGTFNVGDTVVGQQSGATGTITSFTSTTVAQNLLGVNNQGVQISFGNVTGHNLGDTWQISVWQAVNNAFANFYYTLPIRRPGEGYIATLPSNFWTMGGQENVEYINMQNGVWWYFQRTLNKALNSEQLDFQPLKIACSNKAIDPWMVGYMENDLVFVGSDKVLNLIGRMELIQLPQIGTLSKPVQNDFDNATFTGGTIVYNQKRLNVTSPNESIQFQYDNNAGCKYWNPPKTFTENGMQSIVGSQLITHSNYRNQSFTMFTNANGDGGNNDEYTVTIRTPYEIYKNRWAMKQSNMAFSEGYITGNPPLTHTVFCDVNGCSGIFPHTISPIVCVSPDDAPLGEGSFGSHALGSSVNTASGYWQEIYPNYGDSLNWRFLAIQIDCTTKSHTYKFLSLGMNAIDSNFNNNDITNVQSVLPE